MQEAASKIGIKTAYNMQPEERLAILESGEKEPSRSQLVKMAKQYRRPLLTFYMSRPPRKGDRGEDFRTLPDALSESQNALVDALVRQTRARQSMVKDILVEEDEAEKLDFIGSIEISEDVGSVVDRLSDIFEIELTAYRHKSTIDQAFSYLRRQIEAKGVFVILAGNLGSHHTDLDTEVFRGFALADDTAPFVVINNLDSKYAWAFTILHETVHLMLGESGVSGASSDSQIEKFCNDVASEFLLPSDEAKSSFDKGRFDDLDAESMQNAVTEFAHAKNLSSSMVAYKLFRVGRITEKNWRSLSKFFRESWIAARDQNRISRRKEDVRISPYVVKRHRLGVPLVEFVARMMQAGVLSTTRASRILDIAPKNIQKVFSPQRAALVRELHE